VSVAVVALDRADDRRRRFQGPLR